METRSQDGFKRPRGKKDKEMISLLKICLIIAFVGTFLLVVLSNVLEPPLISIKEIDILKIDKFVKIRGNISDLRELENMAILNVEDSEEKIKVILYKEGADYIELNEEMQIEVIGKVDEYKKELEIIASKIKEIK